MSAALERPIDNAHFTRLNGGKSGSGATSTGSDAPESLSALLRRFRLRAGLTAVRLADKALVDVDTIGRYERGKHLRGRLATLRALADALRLDGGETAALLAWQDNRGRVRVREVVPTAIGRELRAVIGRRGQSINDVAREIGAPASTLSRVISGERGVTAAYVRWIATRLGLSAREHDRLLLAAGYAPERDRDIKRALALLTRDDIPPAVRAALVDCVRDATRAALAARKGGVR